MNEKYESVIGLEIHVQLLTDSKIFCGCSTKFGHEPNTNVCPICLGHPGILPSLNKKVVEFAIKIGFATNCQINNNSVFARKNYFYPDLPKGYQISQFENPICTNGCIVIRTKNRLEKKIGITRIHIEEDAGKSIHESGNETLIDVNRCGVPLLEIVSEPDIRTSEEAALYLQKIKQIVQYLNICDGNMEEGSLRCDANVSIKPKNENKYGVKTEIKNMNSFRNVERAINFEIERQLEIIENGGSIQQETLLWNADINQAIPLRSKEESHDYRYFPEPDLLPISIDENWKKKIKQELVELPDEKKNRFSNSYNLPEYDIEILTSTRNLANYFEEVVKVAIDYKAASNWIMVDVLKILNEKKIEIDNFNIEPKNLGKLINLINNGTISGKIAKEVFSEMLESNIGPEKIIDEKKLAQISDYNEVEKIISNVLKRFNEQVEQYRNGDIKVFGFFVGQAMKESNGKANPKIVNEILRQKLNNLNI